MANLSQSRYGSANTNGGVEMFGIKRRAEARAKAAAAKRVADQHAAEVMAKGAEAGQAMTQAVDHFITFRARPVAEALFAVFSERVHAVDTTGQASPVDVARVEARIFLEELSNFDAKMKVECREVVKDWLTLSDTLEVRDLIEAYINQQVANIYLEMFQRAVDQGGDVVIALQAAGFKPVLTPG